MTFFCLSVTLVDCDHIVQQNKKSAHIAGYGLGWCLGCLRTEADPHRSMLSDHNSTGKNDWGMLVSKVNKTWKMWSFICTSAAIISDEASYPLDQYRILIGSRIWRINTIWSLRQPEVPSLLPLSNTHDAARYPLCENLTSSTKPEITQPEKDWTTSTVNVYTKFGEVWLCVYQICET